MLAACPDEYPNNQLFLIDWRGPMTTDATQPTRMPTTLEEIQATVRARYGAAALRVEEG
jgi:hypothetical protein